MSYKVNEYIIGFMFTGDVETLSSMRYVVGNMSQFSPKIKLV